MFQSAMTAPRFGYARAAGLAYLGVVLFGAYAEFFVRMQLRVPGDIAQTISNIRASEFAFRLGLMSDLAMLFADVLLAFFLFQLFRKVHKELSLIALFLSLLRVPLLLGNLANHHAVLTILENADYQAVFGPEQVNAMAMMALDGQRTGYLLAGMLFGTWCFTVGILTYLSGFLPRVLGVLMMIAGFAYLTDLTMDVLFPMAPRMIPDILLTEAALAEISLCLWLLVFGKRKLGAWRRGRVCGA